MHIHAIITHARAVTGYRPAPRNPAHAHATARAHAHTHCPSHTWAVAGCPTTKPMSTPHATCDIVSDWGKCTRRGRHCRRPPSPPPVPTLYPNCPDSPTPQLYRWPSAVKAQQKLLPQAKAPSSCPHAPSSTSRPPPSSLLPAHCPSSRCLALLLLALSRSPRAGGRGGGTSNGQCAALILNLLAGPSSSDSSYSSTSESSFTCVYACLSYLGTRCHHSAAQWRCFIHRPRPLAVPHNKDNDSLAVKRIDGW